MMTSIFRFWLLCSALLTLAPCARGQADMIPLQRWFTQEIDRAICKDSQVVHIGSKPLQRSAFGSIPIQALAKDSTKIYHPFLHYLYRRHLVELKHDNVRITIDPLLHLAAWKDFADTTDYVDTTRLFQNTRGLKVAGTIGNQFAFETGFYENQAQWPEYMRQQANTTGVAPGMGRWKKYRFEGFDYSMSYAYMHYQFKRYLRLHAGQGKHFVGHGYRSLLLSDAAYNYPFLSATLESPNKKWQYTTRYMALQTLERLPLGEVPEALFKRKAMTMHYLSWSPSSRLELGLFEGIVWNRFGQKGHHLPSWGAYVPIAGVNTLALGLEHANNVLLGLNARFHIRKDVMSYGQVALDRASAEGLGWQAGIRWFDAIPRLDIQLEYNSVGSRMYAHQFGYETYSHFNQSLGTPVGPGSEEILGIVEYRVRRVIIRTKAQQIKRTNYTDKAWFDASYGTQTEEQDHLIWQLESQLGLRLNVKYNLELLAVWTWREEMIDPYNFQKQVFKSQIFGLSLRSSLHNLYNDF